MNKKVPVERGTVRFRVRCHDVAQDIVAGTKFPSRIAGPIEVTVAATLEARRPVFGADHEAAKSGVIE